MSTALDRWIGRTRSREDLISPAPARGMLALLDRDPESISEGSPLPPGWHWLYFWPVARQSELAQDGHESRGAFLPPVEAPRRMWAGGEIDFLHPLQVGDIVARRSTITDITEKKGRSGPLTFVTLRHEIERGKDICARELQRLVYLHHPARPTPAGTSPESQQTETEAEWTSSFMPTIPALFRFSALTFNAHRIHYDRPYATKQEGYPGVVVHGPLLALLLLDAAQQRGVRVPRQLSFRALRPLFADELVSLAGRKSPTGQGVEVWATGPSGALAMRAHVQ